MHRFPMLPSLEPGSHVVCEASVSETEGTLRVGLPYLLQSQAAMAVSKEEHKDPITMTLCD